MSGLLRRLAERALGVAPTLRPIAHAASDVAAPDRATHALLDDLDTSTETTDTSARNEATAARDVADAFASRATSPQADEIHPTGDSSDAPPGPAVQHERKGINGRSHRASPNSASTHAAPLHPAPARLFRDLASAAVVPETGVRIASRADVDAGPQRRAVTLPHVAAPAATARTDPSSLLAASTPARALASRTANTPSLARGADPVRIATEDTVEVNVSIGRIELIAVHEAPPPRRDRIPARKPRSLDDYLKQRSMDRR